MTDGQRQNFGRAQTQTLLSVLGGDTEARLKTASETLSRVSGRKLDLAAIVRSNGADVALALLHHAEFLDVQSLVARQNPQRGY